MTATLFVAYSAASGYSMPPEPVEVDVLTDATATVNGTAELKRHLTFLPLGPGDVVEFDISGRIVGVVALEPQFIVEVELFMPSTPPPAGTLRDPDDPVYDVEKRLFSRWNQQAVVSSYTHFSCFVSAPSWDWIETNILGSPEVEHTTVLRSPDFTIDFKAAVDSPDLDGSGYHPPA
ncbi:hypothetical protein K8Z61_06160 [Nocardioides sp. TRM66260-LWL]|uniref:hypothetical protein n=1 Tax=Nocardioides sp. TRM66260-LWL TaxID=2874478 RepID=UPI001CC47D8F|nr:hypothetical protein [Nocardioides sp. TRM66260-LWL]MBZ5734075.1 hypothetical protein [Nocardioides sp. TRM66260-LWL]